MSDILARVDCEDVPSEAIDKVVGSLHCNHSYSYAIWLTSLWAPGHKLLFATIVINNYCVYSMSVLYSTDILLVCFLNACYMNQFCTEIHITWAPI